MEVTVPHGERQSLTAVTAAIGWFVTGAYLCALALIVYYDDIQILTPGVSETPTIYNTRVLGVKILDGLALGLSGLTAWYLLLRGTLHLSPLHTSLGIVLLVYCYAGLVGFVYSFFLRYDYVIWLQDFQQTLYMVGFGVLTFHILDSMRKWRLAVITFLGLLAAKNILILVNTLAGVGKAIGDWAFRASQNAEFAYFPMMFFPLLLLLFGSRPRAFRLLIGLLLLVYLFNALVGIYRTVWVMLALGGLYLLFQMDTRRRIRFLVFGAASIGAVVAGIGLLFPRFLDLAWNFKFASIFSWSLEGDRSNATRILEVVNITSYVFRHFAFLQGMGLGAWWDDEARRLLLDPGSGFTYRTRFHTGHMWYITQFLKLGLVGLVFYWFALGRMFLRVQRFVRSMDPDRWERAVMLGLNVGLLCAFISSADFVRLFLMIGVNLGLTARYMDLAGQGGRA